MLKNYYDHQDFNNSLKLLENNKSHPLYIFFNNFIDLKNDDNVLNISNSNNLWEIFCPEANSATFKPELFKRQILKKRILKKLTKPK